MVRDWVEYKGKDIWPVKKRKGLTLKINRKGIKSIRELVGLEDLTDLEVLDLSINQITTIEGLECLVNLKKLILRHNKIIEIQGLNALKNLIELDLAHNNIQEIEGLENLAKLKILILSSNPVQAWAEKRFAGLMGSFTDPQELVKYCQSLKKPKRSEKPSLHFQETIPPAKPIISSRYKGQSSNPSEMLAGTTKEEIFDTILKLKELLDAGALTQDEFERKKGDLLDRL